MFSFLTRDKDKDRDSDDRKRRKDYDRDHPRPRSPRHEDKAGDRPVRSQRKPSSKDPDDRDSDGARSSNSSTPVRRGLTVNKMSVPTPERRSPSGSNERKASLPYPSFSKAHSREAVGSREDDNNPRLSPHTPDPTDVGPPPRSNKTTPVRTGSGAPPSPPLTADNEPNLRRARSGGSMQEAANDTRGPSHRVGKSVDSGSANIKLPRFSASSASLRDAEEGKKKDGDPGPQASSPSTSPPKKGPRVTIPSPSPSKTAQTAQAPQAEDMLKSPALSQVRSVGSHKTSETNTDSDATSVAPDRRTLRKPPTLLSHSGSSVPSEFDSTPITPRATFSPPPPETRKSTQPFEALDPTENASEVQSNAGHSSFSAIPPPPPPPPPAPGDAPPDAPRVDYLLQNGGLIRPVPKSFTMVSNTSPGSASQQLGSPPARTAVPDAHAAFAPYIKLLDDYSSVLSKNGSIAVATGYRSVARRLLDRLEAVFARNISSETCKCIMCMPDAQSSEALTDDTGVSWGEILELVSARRELPTWPPFSIATSNAPLGIHELERQATPFQKMDIDVPEEYRDHYIRQSKKTKQAVTNWLAAQPEDHVSPPQEVDDETLTFAMLTYLQPDQRKIFTALTRGSSTLPESRAPTPAVSGPKSDLMARVGLALQRLYRLPRQPRVPECAMYLLKNPALHNPLATLAAISTAEWEILISGRFDGFLWSGAEEQQGTATPPSRGPSRAPSRQPNGRSASFSRTMTPFSSTGNGNVPLPRGSTPANTPAFTTGMLPSRGPTPAVPVPAATPAAPNPTTPAPGGPVQMDEDTEIAVLAEVEREIYLGMEALEDAFEVLHLKAEEVRNTLRERSAGLALTAQARRGDDADDAIEVRMGTPASGATGWWGANSTAPNGGTASIPPGVGIGNLTGAWDIGGSASGTPLGSTNASEVGEMIWAGDERSELAPDDSASNVGFKHRHRDRDREKDKEKVVHSHDRSERKRRPRRRTERRTPAPVEEEDDDEIVEIQEG